VAEPLQIGILGDYDPASPNLPAIEQSIKHASENMKITAEVQWLPTHSLLTPELDK
jgi:CTP synthase (UTP-ammonia lyase)